MPVSAYGDKCDINTVIAPCINFSSFGRVLLQILLKHFQQILRFHKAVAILSLNIKPLCFNITLTVPIFFRIVAISAAMLDLC